MLGPVGRHISCETCEAAELVLNMPGNAEVQGEGTNNESSGEKQIGKVCDEGQPGTGWHGTGNSLHHTYHYNGFNFGPFSPYAPCTPALHTCNSRPGFPWLA